MAAAGYEFSRAYYGTPANEYSSAAVTPWADLYEHGGSVVVLAGMFLLGSIMRVADEVLDIRTDPRTVVLVLLLFPALVKAENDYVSTLISIPSAVLVWLAFRIIAFPKRSLTVPRP